jgi:PAP2 superfamily
MAGPPLAWGKIRTWTITVVALLLVPLSVLRRPQRDVLYEGLPSEANPGSLVGKLILRLAAQDWLVLGYLLTLLYEVVAGGGPRRGPATVYLGLDLVVFGVVLWVVRRDGSRPHFLTALCYRLGILVALFGSFLELQWILPAASGPPVDADLYALDLRLFGAEPAQAWDRFVRPETTEWFAFFYYGYFLLVAVHVLPALFFGRTERVLIAFGFGFLWLYCVGHVVYTLVPAYGPYAYLKFEHRLEGRVWWPLVERTVASVDGSARTDVFPSLHTAGPAFLAMFSFQQRRLFPFRYTWPPLTFCATQIIAATMFLRWHYLLDICAGLLLAVSGIVAGRVALWWDEARFAAGGPRVWPAFERALGPAADRRVAH